MTTLPDFISPEAKNTVVGLVSFLALWVTVSNLYVALKTGIAQRQLGTRRFTRSEQPVRFWSLVIFFMISVIIFTALLIAVIMRWHDDRVF
jgi:uncharacterized membrane protein YhaH (DUF805 family)